MISDMAFLPNIDREMIDQNVSIAGDLAWIVTHSRTFGTYKGRPIDNVGREMLIMKHDGQNWKITLIHWAEN